MEQRTSREHRETTANLLVVAQAVLLAVLASRGRHAPGRPLRRRPRSARVLGSAALGIGCGCAVAGAVDLGDDLTPSARPRAGSALRTDGAYRHVRHPIYAGRLLAAAGRALTSGRQRHALAAVGLACVLVAKTGVEERYLRATFADYDAYAARVPRLVPRIACGAYARKDR